MDMREEVRVTWGTGIAGYVAESGEPVNIPDAYQVKLLMEKKKILKYIFSQHKSVVRRATGIRYNFPRRILGAHETFKIFIYEE